MSQKVNTHIWSQDLTIFAEEVKKETCTSDQKSIQLQYSDMV